MKTKANKDIKPFTFDQYVSAQDKYCYASKGQKVKQAAISRFDSRYSRYNIAQSLLTLLVQIDPSVLTYRTSNRISYDERTLV